MLGAQDNYDGPNRWQLSLSTRYQRSHRHFVGSEEQVERAEDESEVINNIKLTELGIRYNATPRWSFSIGIPWLHADRSNPIRNQQRVVIARSHTQADALGDVMLTARRLMWKPLSHPNGNVSLGLGLKVPTGKDDVYDTRTTFSNGRFVTSEQTVDQSIQPGDGGWGVLLDVGAFQRLGTSGVAAYGSASYLANPREKNGVPTFRNGAGEEIMSVADQYVARVGFSAARPNWKGVGISLGGRLEGVPVKDLIGGSEGFRRPGYAISAEPGISWSTGPHTVSLNVPYALYRNRTRSVPDRAVSGRHGDAAFADYIVMFGYWRKF